MIRALTVLFPVLLAFSTSVPALADDSAKLNGIIAEYTEATKRLDPYWATYFNVEADLDKFGDYLSAEWLARSKGVVAKALRSLEAVDERSLQPKDRMTYQLFKEDMEVSLRGYDFPVEFGSFNQMGNRFRQYIDDSSKDLTYFPFDTVARYEAFLKRGEGFPAFVDRQIATLKRLREQGYVLSCVAAKKSINTYSEGLELKTEKNPFWRPVTFMPESFGKQDRERLTAGFRALIDKSIVPAFRRFDAFFRKEYLPHCRKGYGIGDLPRGKEWYEYLIEASTNLRLDARTVHETGLREVARINAEIDRIQKEVGYKGTRKAFLASLSADPKNSFKSAKDMFDAFLAVKERVAPVVPRFFSLVPKGDYKIVESGNPEEAAGSYHGPTEMQPIGRFVVNTHNLKAVQAYDIAALSIHEAVPGHHFQIALQFEMKDRLSEYQRKVFFSNAFAEGWALYAEQVGYEMGAYVTPLDRIGALNSEMLRAVRLVVDTGIHAMGWSREKTIQYMTDNMAGDPKDIETEADRYSVLPGQALGYKIGQLKISELRREAEKALGPKFDIREFHRVVIGNGTVSLSVLERQVREWIADAKG